MNKRKWKWLAAPVLPALALGCNGEEYEPGHEMSDMASIVERGSADFEGEDIADLPYLRVMVAEVPDADGTLHAQTEVQLPRGEFQKLVVLSRAPEGVTTGKRLEVLDRGESTVRRLVLPKIEMAGYGLPTSRPEVSDGHAHEAGELGTARQAIGAGDLEVSSGILAVAPDDQPLCNLYQSECMFQDDANVSWCNGGWVRSNTPGAGRSLVDNLHLGVQDALDQLQIDLNGTYYNLVSRNWYNPNLPETPLGGVSPNGCEGWFPVAGSTHTPIEHIPYGTLRDRETRPPRANDIVLANADNTTLNSFGQRTALAVTFYYSHFRAVATHNTPDYGATKYLSANMYIMFGKTRIEAYAVQVGLSSVSNYRRLWKHLGLHELGHAMGIKHATNVLNPKDPMATFAPTGTDALVWATNAAGNGLNWDVIDNLKPCANRPFGCNPRWLPPPFPSQEK